MSDEPKTDAPSSTEPPTDPPADPGTGAGDEPNQPEVTTEEHEKALKIGSDQKVRAEKAEALLKVANKKLEESATPPPPEDKEQEVLDSRGFARLLHAGYSEDQVDFVEKVAKSQKKPVSEIIDEMGKEDSPFAYVKVAVDAMGEKEKAAQAAPPSSPVEAAKIGGKTFDEMTTQERSANWGKIKDAHAAKRTGKSNQTV